MKKLLCTISLLISASIIISCFSFLTVFAFEVKTLENKKGTVVTQGSNLRVRSGPATTYDEVSSLPPGTMVEVLGYVLPEQDKVTSPSPSEEVIESPSPSASPDASPEVSVDPDEKEEYEKLYLE